MDPHELMMTALRAVGVYVLMLAVIRTLGKRAADPGRGRPERGAPGLTPIACRAGR